jgi:hypothetical protein
MSIGEANLRAIATTAADDYSKNGTALTDALIKAAAASELDLTAEHVQRACEMTYHAAYANDFSKQSGSDRYVSFDPPESTKVASALMAKKVEKLQARNKPKASSGTSREKCASAPEVYRHQYARDAELAALFVAPEESAPETVFLTSDQRLGLRAEAQETALKVAECADIEDIAFMSLCQKARHIKHAGVSTEALLSHLIESAEGKPLADAEKVATALLLYLRAESLADEGEGDMKLASANLIANVESEFRTTIEMRELSRILETQHTLAQRVLRDNHV